MLFIMSSTNMRENNAWFVALYDAMYNRVTSTSQANPELPTVVDTGDVFERIMKLRQPTI